MNRLLNWLRHGPLITDGAWATALHQRGLAQNEPADLWNLSHPAEVASLANAYVEAGSRILLTNTFRANPVSLPGANIQAINRAGVAISREAAGKSVKVAGTIGPNGTADSHTYSDQIRALADAEADVLLLETFTRLDDASAALAAAREVALPVIASFAFHAGLQPEPAARRMEDEGAAAIGANCMDAEQIASLAIRLRDACELPIWVKPSAGKPRLVNGKPEYDLTPDDFAAQLPALLDAGACFVGGCCGTAPAFIHALTLEMRRTVTAI